MLDPLIVKTEYIDPDLKRIKMFAEHRAVFFWRVAAVETDMGNHMKQLNGGPGLGLLSMEPKTYECMRTIALPKHWHNVKGIYFPIDPIFLMCDIHLDIYTASIQIGRFSELIPPSDDIWGQARYWKKYWNTEKGKGTEEDFVEKSEIYVEPFLRRD